jgi:hypothetical protein
LRARKVRFVALIKSLLMVLGGYENGNLMNSSSSDNGARSNETLRPSGGVEKRKKLKRSYEAKWEDSSDKFNQEELRRSEISSNALRVQLSL